ncbi:hypothetical protein CC1G_11894 [Coprinopsis cinerea okayama7|uniref:Uncharacterized protein n=1 Tax=Coprinopsis cinerea (strain Okayama-7 / 130 / ATCC MYA-4618 / FGSC 9003) TaxID=240176 RepID=A8P3K8_COPC7|nr:hypothetical protein CC1G_11894 [Coprinopsis cinerea okayama7\|eukprot:XP_001838565.1 hypothetical protein CC1G_11894 [Coprinopsis cinerea okayama7\
MLCRERRSWTAKEDQLLREAVNKEDPNNPNPSKWHAIAKHVPNRTNKDCRKRWFAKMASDVVKGGWSPEEDERLVKGIERYGTRWSLVASVVQTRNSDQCAKRWTDTLNPAIDRTTWTSEADEILLRAVEEHGKVWTKIVKTYFPGRTGLSAKNRYNSITRFNHDNGRGARSRRKSESVDGGYFSTSKTESVSSSSSASPTTPSLGLPMGSPPMSFSLTGAHLPPYDSLSGWQSPSSIVSDDLSPIQGYGRNVPSSGSSNASSDSSYQSVDLSMPALTPTEMGQSLAVYGNGTLLQGGDYFKASSTSSPRIVEHNNFLSSQAASDPIPSTYSQYPAIYNGNSSDLNNHFSSLDTMPNHIDSLGNISWDSSLSSAALEVKLKRSPSEFTYMY